MLRITPLVAVDDNELRFSFVRSGGPGGQHVNTTSTKVELWFDVERSPSLADQDKARLRERLGGRISQDGMLHLSSSTFRSQLRNRDDVVERFCGLLAEALAPPPPPRRPLRPSAGARRQRREDKRRQAALKQGRRRVDGE